VGLDPESIKIEAQGSAGHSFTIDSGSEVGMAKAGYYKFTVPGILN
jgi:hypothetical protein